MSPCSNTFEFVLGGNIRVSHSPGPTNCNPVYKTDGADTTEVPEPEDMAIQHLQQVVREQKGPSTEETITFFHDPNNGNFQIFGVTDVKSITLFDLSGRQVLSNYHLLGDGFEVHAENLAVGMYLLKLELFQ